MFGTIRRYEVDDGDEIDRLLDEKGFVALMEEIPGFVAYYWVNAGTTGASLTVFESREAAEESNAVAARFVKEHLSDVRIDLQDTTAGSIAVHS